MAKAAVAPIPETSGEKTPITLEDGRIVEFGKRQKLNKTTMISDSGEITVRLDFKNGAVRTFTMLEAMKNQFAAHGAEQKLGDIIAGETDPDDAVLAVEDLIKRLDAGEWNSRREGSGFSGQSVLLKALVEATSKTVDQIKSFLETKSQAEKLAMRRSAKLKPIIDRIEAEKAAGAKNAVDTEALFGEIDALQ